MPGPAPKAAGTRQRRNAPMANTLQLPAEGRKGKAPEWPAGLNPSARAQLVWDGLWTTPQAVAWERLGWTRVVARYAEMVASAERDLDDVDDPKVYAAMLRAQTAIVPELRQLEDRLGLSPMAMLRLRWEVVEDEVAARRSARTPAKKTTAARRARKDPRAVLQAL